MADLLISILINTALLTTLVLIAVPFLPYLIRKSSRLRLAIACFLVGVSLQVIDGCNHSPVWRVSSGEGPPVVDSDTQVFTAPVGSWTESFKPEGGRNFDLWPKGRVRYRVNGRHIVDADSRGLGGLGMVYTLEVQSRETYPVEVILKYEDETP